MKKFLIIVVSFCLLCVLYGISHQNNSQAVSSKDYTAQDKYMQGLIDDSKLSKDALINTVNDMYKDDENKKNEWITKINKNEYDLLMKSMVTVTEWSSSKSASGNYLYITGRIKNNSKNPISYWKVTVEFLDENNNILDTDYTNDGEIVKSNAMKEFKIMHTNSAEYKKIKVYVSEYR